MAAPAAAWRSQLVSGAACIAAIGLTLCTDLAVGRGIRLGIVATVPLAIAVFRLNVRVGAIVTAFAVMTRV
ncbi:MAG: hypothetical protein JOY80_05540, partial [Candidatus Dormibacteraeota bacterium]|nr:hypothetical protein [Candidatus Dormibacteraeota bacterium]